MVCAKTTRGKKMNVCLGQERLELIKKVCCRAEAEATAGAEATAEAETVGRSHVTFPA